MTSRTFDDSSGARWEVFEVHRASDKPQAVSTGMEAGWLAFVAPSEKRRLAPYPAEWTTLSDAELERLCSRARVAGSPDISRRAGDRPAVAPPGERAARETPSASLRLSGGHRATRSTPEMPILRPEEWAEVERVVREFAAEARASGWPAVDAMVRLRSRLLERFPGDDHAARDTRRVRRWFVEAFYFERGR